MEKYQKQEKILGNRNSFSRIDPDASAMKMKDDVIAPHLEKTKKFREDIFRYEAKSQIQAICIARIKKGGN